MPWQHFTSPVAKWAAQPTFVIGEYAFMLFAIVALIHAWREGRDHILIWVSAIVAGTANDLIFMALPLVDNFWQAQATIMITERLPLYIPCVYVCFMYYPTVAVRRLRLDLLPQAAATGLVACLFYAPYDIIGAKFLWWTWHDTDLPIAARLLGAPVSSSLWVLTFVAAFSLLVALPLRKDPEVGAWTFAKGLLLVAGLTTVTMVVQMTVLQQLDGGTPGYVALATGVGVYLAIVVWKWRGRTVPPEGERPNDVLIHVAALAYFAMFPLLLLGFDPARHVSAGVHQTVGECYVEQTDVTGMTRDRYLCVSDFDEDFDFRCVDAPPPEQTERYTVCGKPHTSKGKWLAGVGGLAVLGMAVFSILLGRKRRTLARLSAAARSE